MSARAALSHIQIAGCFNRGVGRRHGVRLIGGGEEPLYQPGEAGSPARIRYTRDYAASALHEAAHWCIAGVTRRNQVDYGYWYRPPPRSQADQEAFCAVEVPVQALESRFATACGLPFRVSVDDLSGSPEFTWSFEKQVEDYVMAQNMAAEEGCLTHRARELLDDLRDLHTRLLPEEAL